jgi:DNA mismatch repair enzyme (predicted ATPase)
MKGYNGFDVIHDGEGIPDCELPVICTCMEHRERNELYKTKSMGYRGEAYNSLAKSSKLTIITKHSKSEFAWKVEYNA